MRGKKGILLVSAFALLVLPAGAGAKAAPKVTVEVRGDRLTLSNSLVERTWSRDGFRTLSLTDLRGRDRVWSRDSRDFALDVEGAEIGSELFDVEDVAVRRLARGGRRVTMTLGGVPGIEVKRIAEAYPGIAGFRMQTVLTPTAPLALRGVLLEEAATGPAATEIHDFRAGADWRDPGYTGPPVSVGETHPGTWRETQSAEPGEPVEGTAEWLSAGDDGRTLELVAERNDFPSSRALSDGETAALRVDWSRDVISLGPFEEDAHVESPGGSAGRRRVVSPGEAFALPTTFAGFGAHEGDGEWQFHRYLVERRLTPYRKDVTFNSNGVDSNRISTGARDDMDLATVKEVAAVARGLGVETFILDDGWQSRSGDWEPDSPEHPDQHEQFPPRFPDSEFRAVREAIAPMRLGLWMSPMHFHPTSKTYGAHPEWGCQPAGTGLGVYNLVEPNDGSNEAGIGTWSPAAIPHVEGRIRHAIESWGVSHFKFDFLVWLDCAGEGDLYDYHDAFVAMLDRLQRDHPDVTFEIDETNDYRLFPFESVSRGPSWFQNGSPTVTRMLHNLWNLSPWVPAFSLGQHALADEKFGEWPIDTIAASSLLSHITFFQDPRDLPASVVARAGEWMAFYRAHRSSFTQLVYPLLGDPLDEGWTALQSWNPDRGRGALLAFRQDSADDTRRIGLRNVPDGQSFDLVEAPSGEPVGTVTSAQLQRGIDVTLPARGARVLLIERKTAARRTVR